MKAFGSPRFGQAQNGVLELELGSVDEFRASKAGTATLRAEWKHDKSVTAAYWDPRGRSIVSTSYDDTLRSTSRCDRFNLCCMPHFSTVWDLRPSLMATDVPFPNFKPIARIRHNCQTVSILNVPRIRICA
jgi:WD40 repeat protein